MAGFVPWNSQPLETWTTQYAAGKVIDLDGHRTHYIEKGDGAPLILLHGFFYDTYLWDRNIDALAQHFKVYAMDLWGFGYSTRAPLDYGYPLYARQVRLFMDALDIQQASLAGQSMGGGIGTYFAAQQPKRVRNLLLVDAAGITHSLPLSARFFNLPGIGEFLMGLNSDFVRRKNLTDFFIHQKDLITPTYFKNVTRPQKIRGTTQSFLAVLRRQFFHTLDDHLARLALLDIPVLIVWGREDKAISIRKGEEMHRILSGSHFEILDNAGHVPNFECARAFNEIVIDFLR